MDYRKFLFQPSQIKCLVQTFRSVIHNYSLTYVGVFIFKKFLCRRYYNICWKIVCYISFKNLISCCGRFSLITLVGLFIVRIVPCSYRARMVRTMLVQQT